MNSSAKTIFLWFPHAITTSVFHVLMLSLRISLKEHSTAWPQRSPCKNKSGYAVPAVGTIFLTRTVLQSFKESLVTFSLVTHMAITKVFCRQNISKRRIWTSLHDEILLVWFHPDDSGESRSSANYITDLIAMTNPPKETNFHPLV